MGYVNKETLIEELRLDSNFSEDEISIIENIIEIDKIYSDDTRLKSQGITLLEEKGLKEKFVNFCIGKSYFLNWIENVNKGID